MFSKEIMKLLQLSKIKLLLVVALIFTTAVFAWYAHDRHRHRISVLLPDGTHASKFSVILDYDPIYDYHPTVIDSRDGIVFIPPARAYGRGWESMKITASSGGKNFYAVRYPDECSYPMTVTLEELPPPPTPPSTLQQVKGLLDILKGAVREARRDN